MNNISFCSTALFFIILTTQKLRSVVSPPLCLFAIFYSFIELKLHIENAEMLILAASDYSLVG